MKLAVVIKLRANTMAGNVINITTCATIMPTAPTVQFVTVAEVKALCPCAKVKKHLELLL